jgi:ERF superfamily
MTNTSSTALHPNQALFASIANVQADLVNKFVTTDVANVGKYTYKYVSLPELLTMLTPILHDNGLFTYYTTHTFDNYTANSVNVLNVYVAHIDSGGCVHAAWNLGTVQSDFRTSGGHLTYYYRRLLMGLLGLHPEEDETEVRPQAFNAPQGMPPMPQMPHGVPQFNQVQQHAQLPANPPMPPQFQQAPPAQYAQQQPPAQQRQASAPPQFNYAQGTPQ